MEEMEVRKNEALEKWNANKKKMTQKWKKREKHEIKNAMKTEKNWHNETILAIHVSLEQMKHQLAINVPYTEMKWQITVFLSFLIDEDKNKGATDESKFYYNR